MNYLHLETCPWMLFIQLVVVRLHLDQ